MLAFHEAFADIVALFQHFTIPTVLLAAIRDAGGHAGLSDKLADLAVQFGDAIGEHRALRSAIRNTPKADDYQNTTEPHERGSLLVAAVFAAFTRVYDRRTRDLFRLATNGTGVLPQGDIPHDLAERLAEEAAAIARFDPARVHPRTRLLPAHRPDVRRIPAGPHYRRPRSQSRGRGRLSRRLHQVVPRARHLPCGRIEPVGRHARLAMPRCRAERPCRDHEGEAAAVAAHVRPSRCFPGVERCRRPLVQPGTRQSRDT